MAVRSVAARRRRLAIGLALFLPGLWFGGSFWFGSESDTAGIAAGGIVMTMAMFAGMAIAAPFLIMPVVRWLAAPMSECFRPVVGSADALLSNPLRTAATAVALTIGCLSLS